MIKEKPHINAATIIFLFYLFTGLIFILFFSKGEIVWWLNQNYHPWSDTFFKYYTYFGDGRILFILGTIFLFIRYYYFVLLACSVILETLMVHLFKRVLYPQSPRPKLFFETINDNIHWIDGVGLHTVKSFPSGHTALAFSIATLLILLSKNKATAIILMLAAILVGFSRMVLFQHFFVDIYVGSILGCTATLAVYYYFEHFNPRLKNNHFFKKSLLSHFT